MARCLQFLFIAHITEHTFSAEGRSRTDTDIEYPRDFKSLASANFATPASRRRSELNRWIEVLQTSALTTWLRRLTMFWAGDGTWTRDIHLGKVVFYHWTTPAKRINISKNSKLCKSFFLKMKHQLFWSFILCNISVLFFRSWFRCCLRVRVMM